MLDRLQPPPLRLERAQRLDQRRFLQRSDVGAQELIHARAQISNGLTELPRDHE
jgi:hypothetical protein